MQDRNPNRDTLMQPINLFRLNRYHDDRELAEDLRERGISLTPDEVRKIADMLGRSPSIVELYIFNGEWSEHCSYKSSRKLLRKYMPTEGPTVLMGPGEDSGILALTEYNGKRYGLVVAHESHNHPSQVLPIEGAATGVGGIVRDVSCMGADVVGVLDCLRFGNPFGAEKERTRWIIQGVVQGIMEYGNALGVPNLGGDVAFHSSFDDNCLVNVIALGLLEEEHIIHSAVPPEAQHTPFDVILIGKPTDFSGFGGAAFASEILDEDDEQKNLGAIQVHDPFLENVLVMRKAHHAVWQRARERGFPIGFKDLGGAGLACAAAEIADAGGMGIAINLDHVHKALDNLLPEVICLAETQERFILTVPQEFTAEVLKIYNEDWELPRIYEGAAARVIGRITDDGMFTVTHQGEVVAFASCVDVCKGILYDRPGKPPTTTWPEPQFVMPESLNQLLTDMMRHPNVCSRRKIFEHYDSEVQGNAVLRSGEADAGVFAPLIAQGCPVGVAVAADGNPLYGRLDAYWGGACAVAESVRNVIAVGASPLGLTDCLNFGNPTKPEAFWAMETGIQGLSDAANKLTLPSHPESGLAFVSGNVSLYNESVAGVAIDPSPIVACFGKIDDISKVTTLSLKEAGNYLFLLGERRRELGGSLLYQTLGGEIGGQVPTVDFAVENALNHTLLGALRDGLARACHDISEGGLAVTAIEMCINRYGACTLGVEIDATAAGFGEKLVEFLFSESGGFVVEVAPEHTEAFLARFKERGLPIYPVGVVTGDANCTLKAGTRLLARVPVTRLREAWATGLDEIL